MKSDITLDQAHVLLDALAELKVAIARGLKPWASYEGGEDDPKLTEGSYRQLVAQAQITLEQGLSENRFPV